MRELGSKMGEKAACGGFSVQGRTNFLCGAAGRFCIRKTPDFHLLANTKGASSSDQSGPVAALPLFGSTSYIKGGFNTGFINGGNYILNFVPIY